MNWLRSIIRHFLGHTRYHQQAQDVTTRRLRQELLAKQLTVVTRGKR